ncbi:minor extracellular protease vpr [Magnaporthiopsis poae ATCC 64411]|uniref:Minor extracellular protease vpr n=1 Tax=Magnaporthiopsis poae (strain ATCC 64411 / 73-15) TaxID=644358 RepID=A0A0C4EF80_MAGP6|nr:minor extracellular protease vpr [Magnaporthiopsis poae ATCC 64411]
MRITGLVPALLALSGIASARSFRRDANGKETAQADIAPKKFIVELDQGSDKDGVIRDIESRPGCRVTKVFDSAVFKGISVETDSLNTDSLQSMAAVVRAWHATRIELPPVAEGRSYSDDAAAPEYFIHDMTGVDRLHKEGILGKGAKIAVVDTGVDYSHRNLGGCFGEGCKVAGGYDFVGDNTNWPFPGNPKIPDGNPMDQQGHGTHVAGIIAGKSDRLQGVAPDATLYAYKIFAQGGTDEETIIEAFLRAYEDGVDIISASVGSSGGWAETAWAEVSRRLVDEGLVVVIAASNDGQLGPWQMSSGASAPDVLAVASVDAKMASGRRWAATFNLDGHSNRTILGYRADFEVFPQTLVGLPIVPITLNSSVVNDTCQPLPENLNLTGVIPLIRLGGCTDMTKEGHANKRGAKWVLMYMEDGRIASFSGGGWAQSRKGMITNTAGKAIIDTILAGGNVTADFSLDSNQNYVGMYNSAGGKPSIFTSWGPNYDLSLKPDIAAPGGRILSTYPNNRFREASGTSMATPYIAGVAALYISKFGGRSVHGRGFARELQARIMNTGRTVEFTNSKNQDFGFWAPPIQVGTGLVDAVAVLNYTTSMSVPAAKFSLNDTRHFSRYHGVDITNNGRVDVEYRFSVQDAAGFETQWTEVSDAPFAPRIKELDELVPIKIRPEVSLPQGRFVVGPGQTRRAQFNFKAPPPPGEEARLPVYSGKVLVSGSNGDELSVPYFGVAADLKRSIPDMYYTQNGYPQIVSGLNNTPIATHRSWTFNTSLASQDFPKLRTILRYGTRELRWDLFEADFKEREWSYPPVPGKGKFVGAATSFDYRTSPNPNVVDGDKQDVNNTWAFPVHNLPRDVPFQGLWLGRLADGSRIKPGRYAMRVAVLLPFGNPRASDNWQVWKTPIVEVL